MNHSPLIAPLNALRCFEELKIVTTEFLSQLTDGKDYYNYNLPVTDELRDKVNSEMAEYGLPEILNFLTFKRKNFFVDDETPDVSTMRGIHLDYYRAVDGPSKASIIIPLSGCEDTFMYYIDGEYDTEVALTHVGNYYSEIRWLTTPRILDRVSIIDQPVLANIGVPHTANSKTDGTYRCTLTLKFIDNLSYEEVYEKLNRHGCIAQR